MLWKRVFGKRGRNREVEDTFEKENVSILHLTFGSERAFLRFGEIIQCPDFPFF